MAGRIIYLEIDDEITSAAARIRASESARLAVVLPFGSRVATSRINFRLLARDALTHEKRLAIVAADPATRALAASAGLPVFGSVAEYESSLAGLEEEAGPSGGAVVGAAAGATAVAGAVIETGPAVDGSADLADAPSATDEPVTTAEPSTPDEPAESDGTLGLVVPGTAVGGAGVAAAGIAASSVAAPLGETGRTPMPGQPSVDRPSSEPAPRPVGPAAGVIVRSRGRGGTRTPWIVGAGILALAVLVGLVGAYLLLPSATISVTPRPETVGPIQATVVADPDATAPDAAAGVVPAEKVTIPVSVDGTFDATGKRVELTKATGAVRFENRDPTSSNRIAAGSVVRTGTGVRFRTDATITVSRAELVGLTIFPARASVRVTAVEGGPEGNVEAGTIVIVPNDENGLFLKVSNPQATSGGSRREFTRVTQADVDGALASLDASLDVKFAEAMADPDLTAGGVTVFPTTGTLGEPTPSVAPDTLVGEEVATFELGLSATGTVVTADTSPVAAIAETQLRTQVKPGYELVEGSVEVEVGDAIVDGQTVSFPVTASAEQVAILDPAELTKLVLGKPVEEAKAILEPYGAVELSVWPDWVGSVPSFESRVDLTVNQAVEIATPAPSGSGTP